MFLVHGEACSLQSPQHGLQDPLSLSEADLKRWHLLSWPNWNWNLQLEGGSGVSLRGVGRCGEPAAFGSSLISFQT